MYRVTSIWEVTTTTTEVTHVMVAFTDLSDAFPFESLQNTEFGKKKMLGENYGKDFVIIA